MSLVNNFAVFLYESLDQKEEALKLIKEARKKANAGLDRCDEIQFKEAKEMIEVLEANILAWDEKKEE